MLFALLSASWHGRDSGPSSVPAEAKPQAPELPVPPALAPNSLGPGDKAERETAAATRLLAYHQELAAKGDTYGLYQMGRRYLHGDGVETNVSKALDLLGKAAQQGSAAAKAELEEFANSPRK